MRELFHLDPEICFLNHGSFGACPREVLAFQHELQIQLEREPVHFMAREYQGRIEAVRDELAPFIGADAADLVPVRNATVAVNSVLGSITIEPGDEVLVTNHGYNACSNAARFRAERSGARVVVVDVPFPITSGEEVVEAILAAVTSRTRLALIDHVTSPTGMIWPIERIVSTLRSRGVETLVDGAHAVGMLHLNLNDLGAGYYTSNAHKWLCAPKGAAFLHVRHDLQAGIRPAVISHGANALTRSRSRFLMEFDWCGTDDPTPWLTIPSAMHFLRGLFPGGFPALREHNHALVLEGRDLLCAALKIAAPVPDEMLGSLASVPIPDGDSEVADAFTRDPLHETLFAKHRIEVPISGWPKPPKRVLRISAQAYNTRAEYEALAAVLSSLGA